MLIPLGCQLETSTPVVKSSWPNQMFKGCLFYIEDQVIEAIRTVLDLYGSDVILSMD